MSTEADRFDEIDLRGGIMSSAPWMKTSFLCGGASSYGLLTDAVPVATRQVLIAANGYATGGGGRIPLYAACDSGIGSLMQETFPMLRPGGVREDVLRMTFGDCSTQREYPLARFCAALAEAVGADYLVSDNQNDDYRGRIGSDAGVTDDSVADICRDMGSCLSRALGRLQVHLTERDAGGRRRQLQAVGPEFYEVDFGACRITPDAGNGGYAIEWYTAGTFRLFLLDGDGLFPLWEQRTERISPDSGGALTGRRMVLQHPSPFALLLLSDSVCAPFRVNADGSVPVCSRLRLEARLQRLILSASSEQEIGAGAALALADLASGETSVSGAVTVWAGSGADFSDFRNVCSRRFQRLEEDLALLPDEYDPNGRREETSCREAERRFVRDLLENRPELLDRTVSVLERIVQKRLVQISHTDDGALREHPDDGSIPEVQSEGSENPLRVLTVRDVYHELRRFDAVNDRLRDQIARSRHLMHGLLAEHWITLRPILCMPGSPGYTETASTEAADRQYDSCLELNRRLEKILQARRVRLASLRGLLTRGLLLLDSEGDDWVLDRGSQSACLDFFSWLDGKVPALTGDARAAWGNGNRLGDGAQARIRTDHFVSLQTAYTAERENLFDRDAKEGFSETWESMLDGSLSDSDFRACRMAVVARAGESFGTILDVLRTLADGVRRMQEQIAYSGAEGRCIRTITDSFDWQFACVRGAVYRSDDWQEAVEADLIDNATASAYRRVVTEWHEARSLEERRRSTYAAYRDAWSRYLHA